jgi:hypothetical protein
MRWPAVHARSIYSPGGLQGSAMPARRTLRAAAEMIGCAVLGLAQQPARLILVIWRARDSTFTRVGVIAAVLGALVPVWLAYVGPTGSTRSSPQPAVDRTGSPATTAQQLPDDSSRCVPAIPSPRHDGPDFVVCVEAGKEVRTEGWQDAPRRGGCEHPADARGRPSAASVRGTRRRSVSRGGGCSTLICRCADALSPAPKTVDDESPAGRARCVLSGAAPATGLVQEINRIQPIPGLFRLTP